MLDLLDDLLLSIRLGLVAYSLTPLSLPGVQVPAVDPSNAGTTQALTQDREAVGKLKDMAACL